MIIKFKLPRTRRAFYTEGLVMAILALACIAQVAFSLAEGREMLRHIDKVATTTAPTDAAHPVTPISCLARAILANQEQP